jgi:hypothetical protein
MREASLACAAALAPSATPALSARTSPVGTMRRVAVRTMVALAATATASAASRRCGLERLGCLDELSEVLRKRHHRQLVAG